MSLDPHLKPVPIEEAEKADVIVCMVLTDPLFLADNAIDVCFMCGQEVQLRPYPHAPKAPKRVCIPCACEMMTATKQ